MTIAEMKEANPQRRELPAAPNPDHYADLATWRDAVAEWDRQMELAAGSACCSDEATPEQQEAFDNYEAALAAVRKAREL